MNEEKQLQKLKEIQINPAEKERDFQRIETRVRQKRLHWQVPVAVIGIFCIIVLLVASMPKQQMITSDADEEPQLEVIYALYGKGNPTSKWQMGVDEFTEHDELLKVETFLSEVNLVERSIQEEDVVRNTYRLNYANGSHRTIVEYASRTGTYFHDRTNNRFYAAGEDVVVINLWLSNETKKSTFGVLSLFLMAACVSFLIGKKMRDPQDEKRFIPKHSTIKQSIVLIVLIPAIFLVAFIVPHIHYFYVACLFLLPQFINIRLETLHGNNPWRKIRFIVETIQLAILIYIAIW